MLKFNSRLFSPFFPTRDSIFFLSSNVVNITSIYRFKNISIMDLQQKAAHIVSLFSPSLCLQLQLFFLKFLAFVSIFLKKMVILLLPEFLIYDVVDFYGPLTTEDDLPFLLPFSSPSPPHFFFSNIQYNSHFIPRFPL